MQAPELVALRYRAIVVEDSPPVSFGCTPSLKGLYLGHYQDEGSFAKLKLSELLVNGGGQLEVLFLAFENGKERTLCTPTVLHRHKFKHEYFELWILVITKKDEISLSSSPCLVVVDVCYRYGCSQNISSSSELHSEGSRI